jgi:hypothetical protein
MTRTSVFPRLRVRVPELTWEVARPHVIAVGSAGHNGDDSNQLIRVPAGSADILNTASSQIYTGSAHALREDARTGSDDRSRTSAHKRCYYVSVTAPRFAVDEPAASVYASKAWAAYYLPWQPTEEEFPLRVGC